MAANIITKFIQIKERSYGTALFGILHVKYKDEEEEYVHCG